VQNEISDILKITGCGKEAIIPILQAIQNQYNYLPEYCLKGVCKQTEISPAEIIGVASFYSQFRFKPAGKHRIKVCSGTACHVKGAEQVFSAFKRNLNIPQNEDTDSDRKFTVEKVGCLGCCSLAPAVQIDNITYGHVNSAKTNRIIQDFINRSKGKKSDSKIKDVYENYQGEIRIGLGSCCIASGSEEVRLALEDTINKDKLNVNIKQVGCVGMCHQVPLLEIVKSNEEPKLYAKVKPEAVGRLIRKQYKPKGLFSKIGLKLRNLVDNIQFEELSAEIKSYGIDIREKHVADFLDNQILIATEHRGILNPADIDEYIDRGGFQAIKKAITMSPANIIDEIIKSGIKGRGGAGFPTGEKWKIVSEQESEIKYIICNGDEGDPGAFMDRMILESYPYRIIEGMLIAAKATEATSGYIYIRAEYPLAVLRMQEALKKTYDYKLLGKNILDSGLDFDIKIKQGAGAFVCGEETALIASIQGERGFPKFRPPYPAVKGLWDKPTLINNTETFAQIPYILSKGQDSFSSIGTENSKGTKVFALAGKINRGGLIEVPMGITIRKIVEEIGGGVQYDKKLKAVQIGGPSGACVPESLCDYPIDFESLDEIGAMMGSGGLVVLDQEDCMVDIARYFLSFTQNESCGKCTFCRIGTRRMLDILERFCEGKANLKDLEEIEKLALITQKGSLCGLGKTAPNPVLSSLKYFREEYLAHIEGNCPAGKCKSLISYSINEKCIGCTICAQQCPLKAIQFNPHKQHEINQEICIKCDNCRKVCPKNAVVIS
jgi:NADH-quinone oxidoreductase subunit F